MNYYCGGIVDFTMTFAAFLWIIFDNLDCYNETFVILFILK